MCTHVHALISAPVCGGQWSTSDSALHNPPNLFLSQHLTGTQDCLLVQVCWPASAANHLSLLLSARITNMQVITLNFL